MQVPTKSDRLIFKSFFGINFGGGAEIDIILDDADNRKVQYLLLKPDLRSNTIRWQKLKTRTAGKKDFFFSTMEKV